METANDENDKQRNRKIATSPVRIKIADNVEKSISNVTDNWNKQIWAMKTMLRKKCQSRRFSTMNMILAP